VIPRRQPLPPLDATQSPVEGIFQETTVDPVGSRVPRYPGAEGARVLSRGDVGHRRANKVIGRPSASHVVLSYLGCFSLRYPWVNARYALAHHFTPGDLIVLLVRGSQPGCQESP
jgi:hypothetical protein